MLRFASSNNFEYEVSVKRVKFSNELNDINWKTPAVTFNNPISPKIFKYLN